MDKSSSFDIKSSGGRMSVWQYKKNNDNGT